jgi:predicted anti-sigma-YlaC factor YlaD
MKESCKYFEEMLVEYADEQLSAADSSKVADHLSECDSCRTLLSGLQKSLDLAGVVWADCLADGELIRVPGRRKIKRLRWLRYAAVAAVILIVATVSVMWRAPVKPQRPELTFAQIERSITESATAARLLAAAELLAESPATRPLVRQQYRYIVETYPETTAAAEAKSRIQ